MFQHTKNPINRSTLSAAALKNGLRVNGLKTIDNNTELLLLPLLLQLAPKGVLYVSQLAGSIVVNIRTDYFPASFNKTLQEIQNCLTFCNLNYLLYVERNTKVTAPPNEVYLIFREPELGLELPNDPFASTSTEWLDSVTPKKTINSTIGTVVQTTTSYNPHKFETLPLYAELCAFETMVSNDSYVIVKNNNGAMVVTCMSELID